jgi:hypothetical protein
MDSVAASGVVFLGWGSLTYQWEGLSLTEPVRWRLKGPTLPIEFSRVSQTGHRKDLLTAVIDEGHGAAVPTRVSTSKLTSLTRAREELRLRESKTRREWIGSLDRDDHLLGDVSAHIQAVIRGWLLETEFAAVVWTAIPPDFGDADFTIPAAVDHFKHLDPAKQQLGRDYIAWAPPEVDTPLRRTLRDQHLLDGADPRPIDVSAVWEG